MYNVLKRFSLNLDLIHFQVHFSRLVVALLDADVEEWSRLDRLHHVVVNVKHLPRIVLAWALILLIGSLPFPWCSFDKCWKRPRFWWERISSQASYKFIDNGVCLINDH